MNSREVIYVIQPVEGPNSDILYEEIVALIESAGAEYAGTISQKIREIDRRPISARVSLKSSTNASRG